MKPSRVVVFKSIYYGNMKLKGSLNKTNTDFVHWSTLLPQLSLDISTKIQIQIQMETRLH